MEWSEVIDNPVLKDLPFKIELNKFGKLLMNPASNKHGLMQGKLSRLVGNKYPSGQIITECSIQTTEGVKVADVAWASDAFIEEWGTVTPFPRAPELCIEIVSPSNSREEMRIKTALYLEAGAQEVWIVYLDSHLEIFTATGPVDSSAFSEGISDQLFKSTK